MSQFQPPAQPDPQGQPPQFPPAPQQFGQASGAPQAFGQASAAPQQPFGQASAAPQQPFGQGPTPPQQQGFGQPPAAPQAFGHDQQPYGGYAAGGPVAPRPTGGLFDTSFATANIAAGAKTAYLGVMVLAGALALWAVLGLIGGLIAVGDYGSVAVGAGGIWGLLGETLVLLGAGFAVLALGRLVIDHIVAADRDRG